MLHSCSGLRILASSREGLGIAGEQIYRVPSLSLPNPRETASPETLSQYEAVQLFVERALAASPTFAITNQNAGALAQLCFRLDCIPLAIELAAARVKALSVEKLLERLDDRFRLLTGGSRTALPRQQTLRALIDWSYDLLGESERALLQRLSVFAGGWTLEGAESVCADEQVEEWEVLDLLTGLVDKSLVVYEEEEERYRLLEPVRQYARDRLLERGAQDVESVRARHLDFFLQLAETAETELNGSQSLSWLTRLEQEHDNLRAALAWCKGSAQTGERGLRLGAALGGFWRVRGYLGEGREHLSALLASAGAQVSQTAHTKALRVVGVLAYMQSDYAAARLLFEESLVMSRGLGDKQGVAGSLNGLGNIENRQGDYDRARALFEESLAIYREAGDKKGEAILLNNLGNLLSIQGDTASARSLLEESLAINREVGGKYRVALSLSNLGFMALGQGDSAGAHTLFEESLVICRELGDKQGVAHSLANLGHVLREQGNYARARVLYEESLSLTREIGYTAGVAYALVYLGDVAHEQGDATARALVEEGLRLYQDIDDKLGIAIALGVCAHVAVKWNATDLGTGHPSVQRAVRLRGAAEALRESIGLPLLPVERAEVDKEMEVARGVLDEPDFESAWEEGRAMSLEQAIAYALEKTVP